MISQLICQNFRSLEAFELPLANFTVLAGANGAGKSTALQALDFLLGDHWPSLSYLHVPNDFTAMDSDRSLKIQARFDEPLTYDDAMGKSHEVGVIEYLAQPYKVKHGNHLPGDLRDMYVPLAADGSQLMVCTRRATKGSQPAFGPLTSMTGGLREQARVLSVTENRTISAHQPGRRNSILNRLLAEARASYLRDDSGEKTNFRSQYSQAVEALRTPDLHDVELAIADTARKMLGFKGAASASSLEVEFGFADPGNPHSSLRLLCKQDGLLLPAEALGAGEQSALVVGLFETFRQRGGVSRTILIEEPERYLYPQAQRYFKNILLDLVDNQGAQIILSTHSSIFADLTRFTSLRLLRRDASNCPTVDHVKESADTTYLQGQLDRHKLSQYLKGDTSELLFSKATLLVEGHGDRLASLEVASKLGLDVDAEGLAIIDCGGKSSMPFFARLCRSLRIPAVALHDSDIYVGDSLLQWQTDENASSPAKNKLVTDAISSPDNVFIIEPTLENVLGVGRSSSDKPLKVYESIRDKSIDSCPPPLVAAVRRLAEIGGASLQSPPT